MVSGSEDETIIVWNVESGDKVRTLKGHPHFVNSVAITPDDKNIVSWSGDKTAKVWSMDDGKILYTFEGHT